MLDTFTHEEFPRVIAVQHVPFQGILKRGNVPISAYTNGKEKEKNTE